MENTPAGWLVLHTEGCESTTYPLHEGKNRIGRKTAQNNPDVSIERDIYVSRNHAVLVVRKDEKFQYEYFIADNAEVQGKPSLNGTYLNGNTERLVDKVVKLKDGDTIQIGVTKFVLQTAQAAVDVESAIKLTKQLDYTKTVEVYNSNVVLKKRVK
ncbi:MAG: FHA domain-containing protein [Bacteroidales bacterium]|nr:FHA domain-containing protein [Bacteroidales bacterium]